MEIASSSDLLRYLLEFSLSRSATEVVIEVENGGVKELKVTDNGKGILNVTQCIQQSVFREIYPYCEMKLVSKSEDAGKGYYYHSMFGHLCDYKEAPCGERTEICIMDLFFNLSDKYRKLRSDSDERKQIINTACEFYILHGLEIKLISGNKVIFHLPPVQSIEERVGFLPPVYYEKRLAVMQYTCGSIHILKLKNAASDNVLEIGHVISEEERQYLKQLLNFDKTIFAIVYLKQKIGTEEFAQIMLEIEQRLEQWKLNKERNKMLSENFIHKPVERETLLRARIIKGSPCSESPEVTMDNKELRVILPNGLIIIMPIRQLGY